MNVFKRNNYLLFAVMGLCVLTYISCASTSSKEPVEPKVSSYIRTWPLGSGEEIDKGVHWNADMVHGEYLTDLIIGFALIDQNDLSSIYVKDMVDQESELTPGLIVPGFHDLWEQVAAVKAKFPHIKVNLSVGGFGAEFTDTADSPELRSAFIANVCDWLEKYNLDGVDIDWEYPVGPDWGQEIKSKAADRRNYISLLTEVRAALDTLGEKTGKRYGLSSAVPASNWFLEKNSVAAASRIVDSLKLMSYDYYGGWSKQTGHHANLYNNPADPDWGGWSTDQAVKAYLNAGVAPGKIMLGAAFYGRAWSGVPDNGKHGLYQPYEKTIYEDGLGWHRIQEFLKEGSGFTRYWDDVAKAPFLYNGDIFVSYTDEEAIKLLNEYAKNKKLGGVFTWEYAHDINADLLKVLAEGAQ